MLCDKVLTNLSVPEPFLNIGSKIAAFRSGVYKTGISGFRNAVIIINATAMKFDSQCLSIIIIANRMEIRR